MWTSTSCSDNEMPSSARPSRTRTIRGSAARGCGATSPPSISTTPPTTRNARGVYSDLLQNIARRKSGPGFDADAYRDRWVQILKAADFEVEPWKLPRLRSFASGNARPNRRCSRSPDRPISNPRPPHPARPHRRDRPKTGCQYGKGAHRVDCQVGLDRTRADVHEESPPCAREPGTAVTGTRGQGSQRRGTGAPPDSPVTGDARPRRHQDPQPGRSRPWRGKCAGQVFDPGTPGSS